MTIFNQLKDVLEKKSGTLLDDTDMYSDFSPYLICRWLSMYDPNIAELLNNTTNQCYAGLNNKDQWYKLLLTIVPKSRYRYIKYIKKSKQEKNIDDDIISKLSDNLEISKREVEEILNHSQTDMKKIKGMFK